MEILIPIATLVVILVIRKIATTRKPAAVNNKNQIVIDKLIKSGSNPEKEHPIDFAFFGDWADMNKLKEVLINKGYKEDASQTDKMLIMVKPLKLHLSDIEREINIMESFAAQFNVKFDGWGTIIVR